MTRANGAPADPSADRGVHDRDLDATPGRPGRGRRHRRYGTYQGYQRLVANPFLALLATVAWFFVVTEVVKAKRLVLFWPVLGSLALVAFLFQFHCLDCGATGHLSRWRHHACGPVRLRYEAGFARRVRFPTPVVQTVVWVYAVVLIGVIAYVLMP